MKFIETPLAGSYEIHTDLFEDNRGFFRRTWCQTELSKKNLSTDIRQCNVSFNKKKYTVRGMHYQDEPYGEVKIISCLKGAIYDVIIDLRPESKTQHQWFAITLSEKNHVALYVPRGFAHGFQTLEDDTYVSYAMHENNFQPDVAKGILWNDPFFSIKWPSINNITLSDKDRSYNPYIIL